MFDCHCQDTTGRYVRMSGSRKLWICDLCKGCRVIHVTSLKRETQPKRVVIVTDFNLAFLLKRRQRREGHV